LKRDFRILTEIGNLLYKEKNKPAFEAKPATGSGETPSFTSAFAPRASAKGVAPKPKEKYLNKNNLFPLSLFQPLLVALQRQERKGSFLTKKTYDYLNSVSLPTNLRGNLNEQKVSSSFTSAFAPRASAKGVAPKPKVKTSLKVNDVIYQYLKTFSIFNKRKNGILIKYNQHIGYNFNSKNILLRGVEPKIISELVPNNSIPPSSGPAVLGQGLLVALQRQEGSPLDSVAGGLKNKNIINHFYYNGPLLPSLGPAAFAPLPADPRSSDKGCSCKGKRMAKAKGVLGQGLLLPNQGQKKKEPKINTEIAKELNRLKGVSGLTGYNRSCNNRLIKYSYKLLFYFFKSMYCLISKPVFLFTPDKVTIQLFYFLNIPKFKVFKWYSILNNKIIIKKWYSLRFNKKLDNLSNIPSDTEQPLSRTNKLNTIISPSKGKPQGYYNKEMMKSVKLTWRIKKTLFRLNKKRNKVKHILFNLNKFNLFKVFSLKFKLICDILSNKFKKPVELQLIRIHQPFHDSNILVNLLSLNIRNKNFKTNVQIEKLYAKKAVKNLYDYSNNSVNFIPTFLSGIKIRIGGRLMREPIIPRITTKNFERGASSPGKVNFLDTATITKKNRKGSYTIKISSGQNFF
jgi:hypothetical protein